MSNNNTFDASKVEVLIDEYRKARTQRERRAIENRVLAATVWRADPEDWDLFATFSKEEFKQISEAVETDDETVRMLLRKPYVQNL